MHNPADLLSSLPGYTAVPNRRGASDPTMTSTFGLDFGDFGDISGLVNDAATQLGLAELLGKFEQSQPSVPSFGTDDALSQTYAALGWMHSVPPAIEPSQLVSPRPSLKRKDSESSADSVPMKRPRGRPPKARADSGSVPPPAPKRPYRRQSKTSANAVGAVSFADDDSDAESESGPKLTVSGKPSTARPKSVVPEKYFKDGSAQAILGMTVDQITAYPTFEELLKKVAPALRLAATEFGERIKENRDKAKDAAKKSRDERRQKIDSLEKTVAELEGKIDGMKGVMMALVARGVLSQADVDAWM